MDRNRFAALSAAFGSRRAALGTLASGGLAALGGLAVRHDASARKKCKKKKRKCEKCPRRHCCLCTDGGPTCVYADIDQDFEDACDQACGGGGFVARSGSGLQGEALVCTAEDGPSCALAQCPLV